MFTSNKILLIALILLFSCEEEKHYIKIDSGISLGQYMFFDKDLSLHRDISCSTCHNPNLAFTDGYRVAFNSKGVPLRFNTTSVLNLHNYSYFSWSDTSVLDLFVQMKRPLFSNEPIEMGLGLDSISIINLINNKYRSRIEKEYDRKINLSDIQFELVEYMISLNSRNSIFDRTRKTDFYLEGEKLFFSDKYNCSSCHGGIDFNVPKKEVPATNIRIPSLRNVELTAPYWHDGRYATLEEVLRNHDDFIKSANAKVTKVKQNDIKELIKFLYNLTDTSYLTDRKFIDPF